MASRLLPVLITLLALLPATALAPGPGRAPVVGVAVHDHRRPRPAQLGLRRSPVELPRVGAC